MLVIGQDVSWTFGGGDFFYAVAVPEASGAAEGGEAAFGGDAGSGEYYNRRCGSQPVARFFHTIT